MQTTTRLLLPFTEEVNAQALDCAVQLAEQRGATLVPLALIAAQPGKGPRLEQIQQAQDFLTMVQRKAMRCRVPIQSSQVYTQDATRSIEAFASEMRCEASMVFLSNTRDVLLGHAVIQALVERANCNLHIVLLPERRKRNRFNLPLHVPLFVHDNTETADKFLQEQERAHVSFIQRLIRS